MTTVGLGLDIKGVRVQALVDELEASEAQAIAAMKSTMGKMARWIRTQTVRELSSKLKIQQNILRKRMRIYRYRGNGNSMKVWYGLNDIAFSRLQPRQRSDGVVAMGGRFIKDGFIAELRGRKEVLKREGRERLPIKVQYAKIADDATVYLDEFVLASHEFESRFFQTFEHELRWRMRILK